MFRDWKPLDLVSNSSSAWIIKIVDANLYNLAFLRFYDEAICKLKINQNTCPVIEFIALSEQISINSKYATTPLLMEALVIARWKQCCWDIDITKVAFRDSRRVRGQWSARLSRPSGQDTLIFDCHRRNLALVSSIAPATASFGQVAIAAAKTEHQIPQ